MRKESGMTLSFLARISGLMELPFPEMGKTKRNEFGGKTQVHSFGHVNHE